MKASPCCSARGHVEPHAKNLDAVQARDDVRTGIRGRDSEASIPAAALEALVAFLAERTAPVAENYIETRAR